MLQDIRQGVCPLCQHDQIIESRPAERSPRGFEAMAVTHERVSLFGTSGFDPDAPRGRLRLYVCRRCGYAQWFAEAPDEIPIGDDYLTRLVQRSSGQGGPYR